MSAPIDYDAEARALLRNIGVFPHVVDRLVDGVAEKLRGIAQREVARRAPAVSRDAGEIVDAVLSATGDSGEDLPPRVLAEAVRIVQRALDAAEERGAEAEREQRAIERRGGPGQ